MRQSLLKKEASGSASSPQPEPRSNPPQEARSNPSQSTEVGIQNTPTYSQDVNSTESPSEEYQLPGAFQVMVLNWPAAWD